MDKEKIKYVVITVIIFIMMIAATICMIIAKPKDEVETPDAVFSAQKITYGSDIDSEVETETMDEAGVTGIVTDVTYDNDPMDDGVSAPETDFMEMQLPNLDVRADEYLGYGFWKKNYININEIVSEPVVAFYYSNNEAEPAGIYLYIPEEKMIVNPERTDGTLFRGEARFNIDRPLAEGTQLILLVNLAYEGQDLGSCYGFAQEKEESEMSDEYFGSTYFTDDELMGGINSDDEPVAEEDTEDVIISE